MTTQISSNIPQEFVWRRLHSLTGLWLVVYIIFHLFTNSQAALFVGDDGQGFIRAVNSIQELPYLPVIELAILGFPILIHMIWGFKYLQSAKYNSFGNNGKTPYLPEYPRNHAYTWQRITSWLLIFGIIAHVIHMRFVEHPALAFNEGHRLYMVRLTSDEGLQSVAERLNVQLYDQQNIKERNRMPAFEKSPLAPNEVIAVAHDFGTAELLMLRNTFKMPLMIVLYTLLVLTACFHAFNGLWTLMISWGITLSERSQLLMRHISTGLMILFSALGLSAVWLTYWINLNH